MLLHQNDRGLSIAVHERNQDRLFVTSQLLAYTALSEEGRWN